MAKDVIKVNETIVTEYINDSKIEGSFDDVIKVKNEKDFTKTLLSSLHPTLGTNSR